MAEKKYIGEEGLSHIISKLKGLFVEQVPGKQLSTNDYTTNEKSKLEGIASGANVNIIEEIDVNSVKQAVTDKKVNIKVPTNNNELTNGAGYQTSSDVESAITQKGYQTAQQVESAITGKGYQTSSQVESAITGKGYQTESQVQELINDAVGEMTGIDFVVVDSLPGSGVKGNIYLVSNSGTSPNVYDEYIWVNGKFEKIGTTEVDLSDYLQISDLVEISNTEIDTLFE